MKIILSGGGTLGSVTPLIAIYEIIKSEDSSAKFIWVGTKFGPEKEFVKHTGISFIPISSGKLRRYFSILNFIDAFNVIFGLFESIAIITREKPDLCISAGGFVSVPLHFIAWLFCVPTWIHQQDIEPGLANKIMRFFAKKITTSLKMHEKIFSKTKTQWIGNPVRHDILQGDKEEAYKFFNLKKDKPIVLATGGGTGSLKVNQMVVEAVERFIYKAQIIHLSGKERPHELVENAAKRFSDYHHYEFLDSEMKLAYAVADIIISRGGFGTISEIAALKKPAILIPKPGHQEENVEFLQKEGAVVLVDEKTRNGIYLSKKIIELLENAEKRNRIAKTLNKLLPMAGEEMILDIIKSLIK
jgi:UDP-N-acetylglucosamine--N-acetylmuramyl-(pentapeptide) pyrophosphoryl-undecaprenol N-acetylglucosamine transferase